MTGCSQQTKILLQATQMVRILKAMMTTFWHL